MLPTWQRGSVRDTILSLVLLSLILQSSAHGIEKLKCGGTEPFWDAQLADNQVTFDLSGGERRIIYPAPVYRAAAGVPLDFVMSVRAKRGKSTLTAFVVNETRMTLLDKNGKTPAEDTAYGAYCSDNMSDRGYPYSIHLIIDGNVYTGCCSTTLLPPVGSD
jgi:uncharacterized membrane protein